MNVGFMKGWLASRRFSRLLKVVIMSSPLVLSACNSHVSGGTALLEAEVIPPKEQVADFRIAQCEHLWQIDDRESMNNALYWLRAMDCAGRLTQFQAREEAEHVAGDSWDSVFKQGILLDNAGITQVERRQVLEQINLYRLAFPAALRPLMQTWRDRQTLFLALSDERLRYKRLQESSDKQLDVLRVQQNHLQYQLETTTQKLENLTDIERQLSSRKQLSGEMPDNDGDRRGSSGANSGSTNKDASRNSSTKESTRQ
ncbi:two-component system QseEF-associated lipoprotein QseG [Pectobacterium brasiliense]|uniref:Two-component system QseEF-associated lipoprotein QseG n=1 Tax=Pectobacterium brasiliense TaxID=180957 RepID=A0AAE2WFE9_9GAMM|nr:two-component system QseEF-associated lipoprotein QseG [Pectobacterium brasiliense]MBA0216809.1 two-component system QseEF-associated lipoprotein QseG [Pectobacterium brasiliense]MBN3050869.1 two-component system QseEF-associated lipoprotein QseG [Pectobacterium brasiliense]MBN3072197.1 two-component system QseEF-associated lipoprotein QseG [Pectobacterium brasiliense]MBN3168141.1 two-component system QseEF-associated lipoprotein QseG [Pectobacterium brasiliense]